VPAATTEPEEQVKKRGMDWDMEPSGRRKRVGHKTTRQTSRGRRYFCDLHLQH